MKKIISLMLSVFMLFALSVTAAADGIVTPSDEDEWYNYEELEKSTVIKKDFEISTGDGLGVYVIPKGKSLTVKNNAVVTLKCGLYIENGGSLIIESGAFTLTTGSNLLSEGKINIKAKGSLNINWGASLIVTPKGSISEKGYIRGDLMDSDVICLGKYNGKYSGIKTKIISAVSVSAGYRHDAAKAEDIIELNDLKTYSAKEARAMFFPEGYTVRKDQSNPIGGSVSQIRFFCDNGKMIVVQFSGGLYSDHMYVHGVRFSKAN